MDQDEDQGFSDAVDQFFTRYCRCGSHLNISDSTLFFEFRAFWSATSYEVPHPALLGQFRVELAKRGYRSSGQKRPRWYGLAMRDNPEAGAQEDDRPQAEEAV
jgi:hypothetical protein